MRAVFSSVGALLISAAVLLVGGGLLSTLVAVRASVEDFPLVAIGAMTSAYYAGFILGCLRTPHLVKKVGHIRVFAALAALTAAATLMHVITVNVAAWFVLRFVTGFAFAGLYMLIESWINEQTPNEIRGRVLSIYRMVDLAAVTAGQFLLTAADPAGFVLFSLAAICISAAIFPISISASREPSPVSETSLNLKKLTRTSPMAVMGVLAVGFANGSFWGVAPVFVQQLGHPIVMVSTFMSAAIFFGALMQWPSGWLSDRFSRRSVMIVMSLFASCAGFFLWRFAADSPEMLIVGAALYGMFAMQIFGLSAAHAADRAGPNEFVAISGGLLLIYGIGSVIGPSIAPIVMGAFGASALFAFTGVVHAMLVIYGLYRIVRTDKPTDAVDYVSLPRPRSLMVTLRLDPRMKLRKQPRRKKSK